MEKLLIVHAKNLEKYANYMQMLLCDKNNELMSYVWTEQNYILNKDRISSQTLVVYMGHSTLIKQETELIPITYDKYGMKYGVMGNRASVYTVPYAFSEDEYKSFIELAKNITAQKNYTKYKGYWKEAFSDIFISAVVPFGSIFTGISSTIKMKKIKDQQNLFITVKACEQLLNLF